MFRKDVLDNGIRVVSESLPHVRSVSIGVWVNVGSRHEAPGQEGVSHFIEHMLFKGTKRRSAQDIAVEVDSIGGEMNAFTSREGTTYYLKVLDEHLPTAIDILSDVLLHSTLAPKDVETERRVILEEIKMLEDTPDDIIHDLLAQAVWPDNSLGHSILGTRESIRRLERKALLQYLEQYYHGRKMVISVAGRFDHDRLIHLLNQSFGSLAPDGSSFSPPTPTYCPGITIRRKELEQVQLCLAVRGLPQSHPDRYALSALNAVLGASMSSRLFQEIREKRGLVYNIYSYIASFRDAGFLAVYAGTDRDNVREVVRLVIEQMLRLRDQGPTPLELEKAREQMKGTLMLSLESTSTRMTQLAKQEIYFGRHFSLQNILDDIERVTVEQVERLSRELITPESMALTVLGPVSRKELPENLFAA